MHPLVSSSRTPARHVGPGILDGVAERRGAGGWRGTVAVAAATMATALLVGSPAVGAPLRSVPCWRVPVTAPVTDPFRTPACRWCAGNRGIEYTVEPGTPVRAAATGRVTFAGRVAGVRYVVVELEPGWRLTYGALASSRLRVGDPVAAGSIVGRSSARLHFGLRVDGRYRDPAPHLGRAVGVPRLVPLDGHPARPAPPARLVCP